MSSGTNGESYGKIDGLGARTIELNTAGPVPAKRRTGGRPRTPRPMRRRPDPFDVFSRIGRGMRYLIGVDEDLMDRVRWERASHASFGAVLVGTATIAAFSMWFAVNESAGSGALAALLPGAIWFLFILNLDRLIVTTRPTGAWHRWMMLFCRGIFAVLLGIVIAEPLVLRVFQTQIEDRVRTDRAANLRMLETNLLRCNPDPSAAQSGSVPPDCAANGFLLAIGTDPSGRTSQVAALQQQADTLRKTIANEGNELKRLNTLAADECSGKAGPDTTGRFGEGINCRTDRDNAKAYAATTPIADQQIRLAALDAQITELQGGVEIAKGDFAQQRTAEIQRRLASEPQVDAPIGLLERMAALAALGAGNATLGLGIVLVRLLFITIDCAPVLMKVTAGRSHYDELVASSLDEAAKTYRVELQGKDSQRAMDIEEQEQRKREHAVLMEQRRADAVEARAAAYERQAAAEASG